MQLTFYGVRGSIPTPGEDYVRYGGNTACVHVVSSDGTDIILDSGTGIRLLASQAAFGRFCFWCAVRHKSQAQFKIFPIGNHML